MGVTWKVAMVLMNTLAALVIIVNSAEEDLETDRRRYDLRPRLLDIGTPNYDQPWRAIESEPVMHQSTPADTWHDSLEDTPQRRRPVRKRKRRPISAEDLPPPERQTYSDENPRYHDHDIENTPQTTEMPRRRRKKPENRRHRWTEENPESDRPLRRRGLRRKRPSVETWPMLSEFNQYRSEENPPEIVIADQTDRFNADEDSEGKEFKKDWFSESREVKDSTQPEPVEPFVQDSIDLRDDHVQLKEEMPLSEFSMEAVHPAQSKIIKNEESQSIIQKLNDKSSVMDGYYKVQDTGIDPIDLKQILKKSNGSSLSEILQQHNLSLSDLLHGRESAISALKSESSLEKQHGPIPIDIPLKSFENEDKEEINENQKSATKHKNNEEVSRKLNNATVYDNVTKNLNEASPKKHEDWRNSQETLEVKESAPKIATKPRFPIRRKLRMRPKFNSTTKGQLNRDLMALTARKYLQHNRNISKPKDWKNVNTSTTNYGTNEKEPDAITTTITPEETTVIHNTEYNNPTTVAMDVQTDVTTTQDDVENITDTTQVTAFITSETIATDITTTEKSKQSRTRPTINRMGLRRQAFDNRLKKKRLKQKISTTEPPPPQDNFMEDLFGMPNLVSSSEFIARTQIPSKQDGEEDFTTLDDFITTEASAKAETPIKSTKNTATTQTFSTVSTTEETAKFEIEEILNDTRTSARLSRILMERNMTLNELVEHRERGSSHVHLADIFHNASKEPNPPEPFLSKSLIEPISKEIYPLRAILEANLHEPSVKGTTIDPIESLGQFVNIPVVMDFGNNVNENGENMGIMSLFNKFTGSDTGIENSSIQKDSNGVSYVTTVISVNTTNINESIRESRTLKTENDIGKPETMSWNELFALMRRNHINDTEEVTKSTAGLSPLELNKQIVLEEDRDGDGLIVVEDLQHLKDFDSQIASASEEKIEVNSYERVDIPTGETGILNHIPSNSRSVTVATASIVGLTMIIFLLTYAAFKWKQQRKMLRKKQSFTDERIPTPVFENRKGHKNNCSTRSISPMLACSNIYTLNTLESQNGRDSPDYMWDSLRKPFQ